MVSSATQAGEAVTGKDLASGETLSTTDRVARGVTGGVGIYAGRGFTKEVGEAGIDGVRRAGTAIKQEVEQGVDALRGTTGMRPAVAGASDVNVTTAVRKSALESLHDAKMVKMHGNAPAEPLKSPASRHYINQVSQKSPTKDANTIIEPRVDVKADVEAINAGKAVRTGNNFEINGRTYGVKPNGTLYPIKGDGFHQLEPEAYNALKIYRTLGDTPKTVEILNRIGISEVHRQTALDVLKLGGKR